MPQAQNLQGSMPSRACAGKMLKSKILLEHLDAVGAVAFSPDGLMLASGSKDKSIQDLGFSYR